MDETDRQSPDPPANAFEPAPGVRIPRSELRFSFVRSSGPGGQSVNKVSTCAELRVMLASMAGLNDGAMRRLRRLAGQRLTKDDELILRSDSYRSQGRNRQACLDRLEAIVTEAAKEPKVRRPTRPTRAAVQRRLTAKRRNAERKQRRREPGDDG